MFISITSRTDRVLTKTVEPLKPWYGKHNCNSPEATKERYPQIAHHNSGLQIRESRNIFTLENVQCSAVAQASQHGIHPPGITAFFLKLTPLPQEYVQQPSSPGFPLRHFFHRQSPFDHSVAFSRTIHFGEGVNVTNVPSSHCPRVPGSYLSKHCHLCRRAP